jgi:hypothetical protein
MFRFSRGGRPPKTGSAARPVSDQVGSLKQLGITKTQSSQWQKLAKIPDDEFEELLRALGTYGVKPTTAGLYPHVVPRTWQAAPGKSGTHGGGATQGRLGGDPSQAGARRSMTARPIPQRHWRSYGDHPLPTGAEALDEPLRAFPSWFLRIVCDRCGKDRMISETHMAQGHKLIRDILDRARHDGCGGRAGRAPRPRSEMVRRSPVSASVWLIVVLSNTVMAWCPDLDT